MARANRYLMKPPFFGSLARLMDKIRGEKWMEKNIAVIVRLKNSGLI